MFSLLPSSFSLTPSSSQVPEDVVQTAAKLYSSWWHEGGPTEKRVVLCRIDPRIEQEEENKRHDRADRKEKEKDVKDLKPKGRSRAVLLGGAQRGAGEDLLDSPSRDTAGGAETHTQNVTPNVSRPTPPPTPPPHGGVAGRVTGF